MGESCDRSWVGIVICGDIDGLKGGDGSSFSGGDTFLKGTHFTGQGGLVTDGGGYTTEKC